MLHIQVFALNWSLDICEPWGFIRVLHCHLTPKVRGGHTDMNPPRSRNLITAVLVESSLEQAQHEAESERLQLKKRN